MARSLNICGTHIATHTLVIANTDVIPYGADVISVAQIITFSSRSLGILHTKSAKRERVKERK
jgi:hypothetical protein